MSKSGLKFLISDRLETLADDLADRLIQPPLPPLETETIVVASRGMARWLTVGLARRHGIAASNEFPFPHTWARRAVDAILATQRPEDFIDPFASNVLPWRVHAWLGRVDDLDLDAEALAPLARYLDDDADCRKRGQLAQRLARGFAVLQLQRPRELAGWERKEWFGAEPDDAAGEPWQAALWRALVRESESKPLSTDLLAALRHVDTGAQFELPWRRLTAFGLSSIPPVVLDLFGAVSRRCEVNVALIAPTDAYWGDLRSARDQEWERARASQSDLFEDDVEQTASVEGHPLLATWGEIGRDLHELVVRREELGEIVSVGFAAEPASTLLGQLQNDIHALRHPDAERVGAKPQLDASDRSLHLHLCHSEMREMEVLHDEILRAFEDGVLSEPADVLLLVTDIERYAPFVRAVFESERSTSAGSLRLPVRIADGQSAEEQPFARLLLLLLEAASGRKTATDMLEFFEIAPLLRRYGLEGVGMSALRGLVRAAGVRWGESPGRRAESEDLPRLEGGSWREGLDRLLLGYAMGSEALRYDGLAPVADATTGRAETAARLAIAIDDLFEALASLESKRSVASWCEDLRGWTLRLTQVDEMDDVASRRDLIAGLDALRDEALASRDDQEVARATLLASLRDRFTQDASGRGFVSGSITVAELRPMRSLPFAMIAVAGLDSESFPRQDPPEGLDLVARHPRRGDRSVRRDDRQLLLEVLLSARRRLALSAIGQSQHDGKQRSRSVCLDELMDVVDRSVAGIEENTRASDAIVTRHSLQPFHPSYAGGDDDHRFTYDIDRMRSADALAQSRRAAKAIVEAPLTDPLIEVDDRGRVLVELEDLARFWGDPSTWFAKHVLGLSLHYDEAGLDEEPFALDALSAWRVRDWLLRHREVDAPLDEIVQRAVVELNLAGGTPGQLLARGVIEPVLASLRAIAPQSSRLIDVQCEGESFVLSGQIDVDQQYGVVEWTASGDVKPKARVESLVRHLALGASLGDDAVLPWRSTLVAARKSLVFEAGPTDPLVALSKLVTGFVDGHRHPLRFFPATSLAFAKKEDAQPDEAIDLQRAAETFGAVRSAWEGWGSSRGDRDREATRLWTRHLAESAIADEEFVRWARFFHLHLDAVRAEGKS